MAVDTLRQRKTPAAKAAEEKPVEEHPGGDVKHGGPKQILRLLLLLTYFMSCCFS